MEYLKIRNWDKWQSYRKDRGQPPWIKLHRRLLRNPEWVSLSDAERGQLVCIWLIGADHDGVIPASSGCLQKLLYLSRPPNLNKFISLGFLENGAPSLDANMTPTRQPLVTPKAETETEAETEADKGVIDAKTKHLDFVFLTEKEHEKLVTEFGEVDTEWLIKELDNYIGAAPKKRNKYSDHNRVLRGWVLEKLQAKNLREGKHGKQGNGSGDDNLFLQSLQQKERGRLSQ